jgi:NitT/TauT family transport system substrate-binding protein
MASLRSVLLGFSCLCALALPVAAQSLTPMTATMAHPNIAVGEEVFLHAVPKKLGWFREEGIEPSVQGAGSGVQAGQVLMSGRSQIAWMLAENMLQLREQGGDAVAFYTLKQNNGFQLAVLPASPIRSLADIKGRSLGFVALGAGSVFVTNESAMDAGLPSNSFSGVAVGMGASAGAALRTGRVDGMVLWDAIYGALENQGLQMRYIDLPVQDRLAGYSLVTSAEFLAKSPKLVEGYCRAIAKGLLFARTNPAAAIRMFHAEFPTVVPAGTDAETAVKNDVNVLNRWLDRAMLGVPVGQETGAVVPAKWHATRDFFSRNGVLMTTRPLEGAYTTAMTEGCNRFDHAAVVAAAQAAK